MHSFAVFILAHNDLAFSLKETAEQIMGEQKNIFPYSNKTESLPILFDKIRNQITALNKDHIYFFVDLIGGSCWNLASMLKKELPNLIIFGGVNLPMIFSLLMNHDSLTSNDLINKVIEDSRKGIKLL